MVWSFVPDTVSQWTTISVTFDGLDAVDPTCIVYLWHCDVEYARCSYNDDGYNSAFTISCA